ncbi:hypothetical protein [Microbispora sp. NPDC049125]|uniref:hypothetical protein n=1 Tax=Microbispora sp. NPDC049125 TaxID=3154929 RepID=UPI003467868B
MPRRASRDVRGYAACKEVVTCPSWLGTDRATLDGYDVAAVLAAAGSADQTAEITRAWLCHGYVDKLRRMNA